MIALIYIILLVYHLVNTLNGRRRTSTTKKHYGCSTPSPSVAYIYKAGASLVSHACPEAAAVESNVINLR